MKKILLILSLFPILVFSQKSYKIPADSTILNNIGSGKNELVIRNATSNITGGVLTNLGNGVTAFVLGGNSARVVDTIYKNSAKDSIVFTILGTRYSIKDSFNVNTGAQTLSIINDTLSISGGNSVVLPIYVQVDSGTITSYEVLNSQNTPPVSPSTGDVYLVGNSPTGAWVGHSKDIAEWNGSAWVFTDGVQGDFLYNATNALTYIFRSGNWVQTTGIPALHNGNTISSGLKIGTNNSRSLTFETNNVNRGRFDSVGRFYVYDTSLRKANKYLQIDSITGRLIASEVSGSSALSSLFPNGVKLVETDRAVQADDAGYTLLLSDGVQLTIPTICPLSPGQYFGISTNSATASFILEGNPSELAVYLSYAGQGAAFVNEVVTYVAADVGGSTSLILLTQIAGSNDTVMTANRYFFEQLQNAIPLTGTEVGKPVTGDIEFKSGYDAVRLYKTNEDEDIVQSIYFNDSHLEIKGTNIANTQNASIKLYADNVTIEGTGIGLRGGMDFTPNITDLDYTQKIYVDNAISSNRKVDTSYIFRNATLDSTCMITVINGITYRSCAKDSVGSGTAYTFSTGLTNTSSTITNNLSTGVSGGQSVIGGTASGENLTLSSTSNATKGDLRFGTSVYKEVNNRLGIGTSTPAASLDILGSGDFWGLNVRNSSAGALFQVSGGKAGFVGFNGSAYNNLDIRCGVPTQLFLSTNGNIGIADANPSQRLSLNGALYFSGISTPSETTAIYAPTLYSLAFMTNHVERIRINNIGNVGIGTTTPASSAILDVVSTTKGFLPPRMTATQASAISTPAQGLLLFVSDTNGTFTSVGWWGYNGATWEKLNN